MEDSNIFTDDEQQQLLEEPFNEIKETLEEYELWEQESLSNSFVF